MRFYKHWRRRGLAMFITIAMCLGMLPAAAMAAGECSTCGGSGKAPTEEKCGPCRGKGTVTGLDMSTWQPVTTTCSKCSGTGRVLSDADCASCGGTGVGSGSADPDPETCKHERTEKVVGKEATCNEEGRMDLKCTVCGTVIEEGVGTIRRLRHQREITILKEPTCGTMGQQINACKLCGDGKDSIGFISPTGKHTWDEGDTSRPGTIVFTCTVCGKTDEREVACSHPNGGFAVTKAPTCAQEGERVWSCPDCGEKRAAEPVPVTDSHVWDDGVIRQPGTIVFTCTVCQKTDEQEVSVDGCAHEGAAEETTDATCGQAGETVWSCPVCGARKTTVLPATEAHTWDEGTAGQEPCTAVFTCTGCGKSEVRAVACTHPDAVTTVKNPTCAQAGEKLWSCPDCGETASAPLAPTGAHAWDGGVMYDEVVSGGARKVTYTCTVCGAEEKRACSTVEEPFEREVELRVSFRDAGNAFFAGGEIPENFSVTYSYQWQGETVTRTLTRAEAEEFLESVKYPDGNGGLTDGEDGKFHVISWMVRVPVDPKAEDPMTGTKVTVVQNNNQIDGYEWDSTLGFQGDNTWHVSSTGNPVSTYFYNTYAKLGSYRVIYHYGGEEESSGGTGRVGSAISYSTGSVVRDGVTYDFSRTEGSTAVTAEGAELHVYFTARLPEEPVTPPVDLEEPAGPEEPGVTIPDPDVPLGGDTTTIVDEQIPLAGAIGLNNRDHFAYMIGYGDGTIRPLANITRAEAATIFFRLMTDEFREAHWATENQFSDVTAGQWFNNAVSTSASAGKLMGYADGAFRPNRSITRAEFAVIAVRFLSDEVQGVAGGSFKDTAGHWAAVEISRAAAAGWIAGDTSGNFRPDDPITRAEAASIINNMLGRAPVKEHLLEGMQVWSDNPEDAWYYADIQEATNGHEYDRDELGVTEIWSAIQTIRDWSALERQWAANGGKAD